MGNENIEDKYVEAGNTQHLENATEEALKEKQTTLTKEDIHTISLQKSKVGNKTHSDRFIKSCKYCGSGHKQGQCPYKIQNMQQM